MKVIAVIPAYEEAQRLSGVLSAVAPHVDQIVVVDDGSRDDTAQVASVAGKTIVLRHVLNRGQGAALRTGNMAALRLGADVIVHLDADGQHNPEQIQALIEPIRRQEMDVVFGSRFLEQVALGMPWTRRLLLEAGGAVLNRFILGIPARVTDPQSGFRVFSRAAAESLVFTQDRYAHASEILREVTRSPWRWTEVPVTVRYSQETLKKGQNSLGALKIAWQLFLGIFHRA